MGKIWDIFAQQGITDMVRTAGNDEGIIRTLEYGARKFEGLCFTNLVDYDMLYGHRNDVEGYGKALTAFDQKLPELLAMLQEEDLLMITADHGCDPSTPLHGSFQRIYSLGYCWTKGKAGSKSGNQKHFCRYCSNHTGLPGCGGPGGHGGRKRLVSDLEISAGIGSGRSS